MIWQHFNLGHEQSDYICIVGKLRKQHALIRDMSLDRERITFQSAQIDDTWVSLAMMKYHGLGESVFKLSPALNDSPEHVMAAVDLGL